MYVQAILFELDKGKLKEFISQLKVWFCKNGKNFRYKKTTKMVVVDLPKYQLCEFRLFDLLNDLPLFLVCEESVKENESVIVCNPDGEKLMPFWTSKGEINAKFSTNFDEKAITITAKRDPEKKIISIIAHEVSLKRKEKSVYIIKKQLFNIKKLFLPNHREETKKFDDAINASLDKLLQNKKKPCFVETSHI